MGIETAYEMAEREIRELKAKIRKLQRSKPKIKCWFDKNDDDRFYITINGKTLRAHEWSTDIGFREEIERAKLTPKRRCQN